MEAVINFMNFRVVMDQKEIRGAVRPVARIYQATPKARYFKEKMISNSYFGSENQAYDYVGDFLTRLMKRELENEAHMEAKRQAKANLVNPFKEGDIVYNSWGYDQTNIDYYQIVSVGPKSVKMRPIGGKMLELVGNGMAGKVVAVKDDFIGDEIISKNLQIYGNGQAYIPARHGCISKWDGKPNYNSWYA